MTTELGSGGEPDQRLSVALGQYETDEILRATDEQKNAPGGDGISGSRMTDQRLSTLIAQYDKHLEEMREQQQLYQTCWAAACLKWRNGELSVKRHK
ncbi:uncharacterized protein FN964_004249 isoform 1-T2 [Alca torda]